eukprot:NODE_328_length_9539_cov_0.346716.p3 type:complete len:433 gc:universal NODE_328_length_9539_cov_0.346716:5143-3845(-)
MNSTIRNTFCKLNDRDKIETLLDLVSSLSIENKNEFREKLENLYKIDFIKYLPKELATKVFTYLDAKSVCKSGAVSKIWLEISESEQVWQHLCFQHIHKECSKCGWSLPSLDTDINIGWKRVYEKRMRVEKNWRLGKFRTRTLTGHADGITALYFYGNILISGGWDKEVIVWDMGSGKLKRRLVGHSGCVRGLKCDGDKLISVSMDKSIKIWNYNDGKCLRTFNDAHTEGITCVDFEDNFVVTGSNDNSIKIWNFQTGETDQLFGHEDWINRVILYKKASIVSCADDNTVRLWDLQSRNCIRIFEHGGQVQGLSVWSPKESLHFSNLSIEDCSNFPDFILSGDLENIIKLWHVKENKSVEFYGHSSGIWTVCINQQRIISGSVNGVVKVWNHSGEVKLTLQLHDADVRCIQMDEVKIVSGSDDGKLIICNFD